MANVTYATPPVSTTTDAASIATASFTPDPNCYLLAVCVSGQGTAPSTHSIAVGGALGFSATLIGTNTWKTDLRRLTAWHAPTGAAPGAGTITFSRGATAQSYWAGFVFQVADVPDDGAITAALQSVFNDSDADVNQLALNLPGALAANSVAIAIGVVDDEGDVDPTLSALGAVAGTVIQLATPSVSVQSFIENPAGAQNATLDWLVGDADSAGGFRIEIATNVPAASERILHPTHPTLGRRRR